MKRATTPKIPRLEATKVQQKKIRQLIKLGWSWNEIIELLDVSKTTISLATKRSSKGKVVKKRK